MGKAKNIHHLPFLDVLICFCGFKLASGFISLAQLSCVPTHLLYAVTSKYNTHTLHFSMGPMTYTYSFIQLLFITIKRRKIYIYAVFYNQRIIQSYIIIFTDMDSNYHMVSFAFNLNSFLSISCKASLLATNSLKSCFI